MGSEGSVSQRRQPDLAAAASLTIGWKNRKMISERKESEFPTRGSLVLCLLRVVPRLLSSSFCPPSEAWSDHFNTRDETGILAKEEITCI